MRSLADDKVDDAAGHVDKLLDLLAADGLGHLLVGERETPRLVGVGLGSDGTQKGRSAPKRLPRLPASHLRFSRSARAGQETEHPGGDADLPALDAQPLLPAHVRGPGDAGPSCPAYHNTTQLAMARYATS